MDTRDLMCKKKDFMVMETPGNIQSSSPRFGDRWQGESEEAFKQAEISMGLCNPDQSVGKMRASSLAGCRC